MDQNIYKSGVILNNIDIDETNLPFNMGRWWFVKPDLKILEKISETLTSQVSSLLRTPLNEMMLDSDNPLSYSGKLKTADYRYYCIQLDNESFSEKDRLRISQACRISNANLWLEAFVRQLGEHELVSVNSIQAAGYYDLRNSINAPMKVDLENLAEIILLREKLDDETFPQISEALEMFRENDQINDRSHLKHLGYFAIIESLLSHQPSPNDSVDSISRQLIRNLILLNNRMSSTDNMLIDKFGDMNQEKVIKKLYSYRSQIAHGKPSEKIIKDLFEIKPPEFGVGLEKFDWFAYYLRSFTKKILKQALIEPQLINDLK